MKLVYPDYYPSFRCLAGACPDTCCRDWEIVLDPGTLAFYKSLPGEFGERVRASLRAKDGETSFALTDGHCPLLTADGLCSVQLALGPERLCTTCREHPRFCEEYGQTGEISLAASCPAAARLLLCRREPLRFLREEDGEPGDNLCSLDPSLYFALLRARERAFSLAQDRARPLSDRLSLLLYYAVRLQRQLDESRYDLAARLTARMGEPGYQNAQLARLRRTRLRRGSRFPIWMLLNNMEHLTKRFPALLDRTALPESDGTLDGPMSCQFENLTVYFLFRYALKAVNDGQLLPRIESCLFHVLALESLASACRAGTAEQLCPLVSLYSREVEHSEENLLLLRRVFARGTLSWRWLLSLLGPQGEDHAI